MDPLVFIFYITSHQKNGNGLKQHKPTVSLFLRALHSGPSLGGFSPKILPAWHKDVLICSWGSCPEHRTPASLPPFLASFACLSFPCCGSTRVPVPLAVIQGAVSTDRCHCGPCYSPCMSNTHGTNVCCLRVRAPLCPLLWQSSVPTELTWRSQAHTETLPVFKMNWSGDLTIH